MNITSSEGSQAEFCCPGHSAAYMRQSQHNSANKKADQIDFESLQLLLFFCFNFCCSAVYLAVKNMQLS